MKLALRKKTTTAKSEPSVHREREEVIVSNELSEGIAKPVLASESKKDRFE